jgi:hypothetical protein
MPLSKNFIKIINAISTIKNILIFLTSETYPIAKQMIAIESMAY